MSDNGNSEATLDTTSSLVDQPEGEAKTSGVSDAAPQAQAAKHASLVETWWNDHFPGSVLGRNTEIWNYVHAAKEDLKRRLGRLA